jgi:hypothetical protein
LIDKRYLSCNSCRRFPIAVADDEDDDVGDTDGGIDGCVVDTDGITLGIVPRLVSSARSASVIGRVGRGILDALAEDDDDDADVGDTDTEGLVDVGDTDTEGFAEVGDTDIVDFSAPTGTLGCVTGRTTRF